MSVSQSGNTTSNAIFNQRPSELSFNHSRSLIQLAQRPSPLKKLTISQLAQSSSRTKWGIGGNERQIKSENFRLVAKLMQIRTRPNRMKTQPSRSSLVKRENHERKREIDAENKRLGKTLLRIKIGKSLKRLRYEAYKQSSQRGQTEPEESSMLGREYNLFRQENAEEPWPVAESKLTRISKLLDNGKYLK